MTLGVEARIRYVADNGIVKGYGGLLLSPGVGRMSALIARRIGAMIRMSAIAAEAEAAKYEIAPGHVVKAFSGLKYTASKFPIPYNGKPNYRATTRIEATGSYEGNEGGVTRSSPVTLEFGSRYNEGTRTDRPALQVMGKAVQAFAAKHGSAVRAATASPRFQSVASSRGHKTMPKTRFQE